MHLETSERSDTNNWLRKAIVAEGYRILSFEGFTVKEDRVSLLLDRACFEGEERRNWTESQIHQALKSRLGRDYDLKIQFSGMLGVPWHFVAYTYSPQGITDRIYIFELRSDRATPVTEFSCARSLGRWLEEFRSLRMMAGYQERGLPRIDVELRKCGYPWPGNLDGVLVCPGGKILCVVEFQTTTRVSVRNHCNNRWFLPRGNRKGDEQRWKVVDIIRQQAGLPLLILVWSPNERDDDIKVKVVQEIVYSNDPNGRAPGLYYSYKQVMKWPQLHRLLDRKCGDRE